MKKSQLLTCNICGKEVFARGLKSHIRLQHKSSTTVQINKEKDIDHDVEETYEELKQIKDFYENVWFDEKTLLKFIAWIREKKCEPEMMDLLRLFRNFLMNGGKTERELDDEN